LKSGKEDLCKMNFPETIMEREREREREREMKYVKIIQNSMHNKLLPST
jgi:hypothetical protein